MFAIFKLWGSSKGGRTAGRRAGSQVFVPCCLNPVLTGGVPRIRHRRIPCFLPSSLESCFHCPAVNHPDTLGYRTLVSEQRIGPSALLAALLILPPPCR